MLDPSTTLLVIIDAQERLMPAVLDSERVIHNLQIMIRGAQLFNVPILALEQVNLGPIVAPLAELLGDTRPIGKKSFSGCGERTFVEALESAGRRRILVGGAETHICVHQTALGLLERGYETLVLEDCVSSRTAANRETGLRRMNAEGVKSTSAEMALYELLRVAEGDGIRALTRLVK
ncbi:MAG: isochorismatase family protein [Syntrophales bacterium]|jgi:nicotinamidase-related amidase|nr:isochorismatase family protein [Syntrophales bacterium]MCK9528293.1 isochorismatase family protein [Syntrophales bacterium]MDX9922132.1 isochorismatase family protein [Syntrophales bacterium]